ncbi:MAG: chalcone isomerase family protein [Sporocytophaga sp.]|uniref:chalcone isomerase family protein n=1 Tax=Sporocytophaga sp. TaxID=2231183 RepID=UPI001B0B072C|nr:chalcone isomerase family protein [Sporocytophaga sp.]MBO9699411.1 chalcone isomerase family protein [Sporocytophaga sp.]
MTKNQILFFIGFLILSTFKSHAQTKIKGVDVPATIDTEKGKLQLNGAGIRTKYIFDLYVGALYLKEKNKDPKSIINQDAPQAIRMYVISDKITNKKMEETIKEGFEKATKGNTAPYKAKIDQLMQAFKEEIHNKDVIDITYSPGAGVKLYKNGKLKTQVEGLDFKKLLFTIWLGDDPADEDLKDSMLGK